MALMPGQEDPTPITEDTGVQTEQSDRLQTTPGSPSGSSFDDDSHYTVPVASEVAVCPVCNDTFKKRWDDKTEMWVYSGAIIVNGHIQHVACSADI